MSKGQIVNANTELIPEAPNRQAIILRVVDPACITTVVVQVAEPSTACIALCRTPPVTDAANVGVTTEGAVTARKRRK